jgi:tRNA (cmo5U34)-methyltransferase
VAILLPAAVGTLAMGSTIKQRLQSTMKEQDCMPSDRLGFDFDGDYGRTYRQSIRNSLPGYDALIEIAAAALQQAVPQAASILVVGPGLGEELVPLLTALPQTRFTLLEPSTQMREACTREIAAAGAVARCELLAQSLEPGLDTPGEPFDAVVCHNVLHLMPPERQLALLQTLANSVTPGGALLLSAHSEPANGTSFEALLAIACARLRQRGLPEAMIEQMLIASRNNLVFSLNQTWLEAGLAAAGMESPLLLQQSLFSRLWLSRRPS